MGHGNPARAATARAKRALGVLGLGAFGFAPLCLPGCQAPGYSTNYTYGGVPVTAAEDRLPISLAESLAPLRATFDEHAVRTRVVALMPHVGCERGAAILRDQILDAYPDSDLRLLVIWQDLVRNNDARAAARASRYLDDERVIAFHDCSGLAGRAFARGKLPVAEAREVFLFYPAGARWPSGRTAEGSNVASATPARPNPTQTPGTKDWMHQIGRVAPERFCDPEDLPGEIRRTIHGLLASQERARAEARAAELEAQQGSAMDDGTVAQRSFGQR